MEQTYPNYVVLPDPEDLTEGQIKETVAMDWFEGSRSKGVILIDWDKLSEELKSLLNDESPFDYGINPNQNFPVIDDCLKRWNEKDGFYHA